MIEVVVDRVQVSLMSPHRLVVLKERYEERYLAIWIGSFEAEAITVELRNEERERPLTHDLLKTVIDEMGGFLKHILISNLSSKDIFYARLVLEINDKTLEIDARSSDAIAIAVRLNAPIFVDESVMLKAGIVPEEDIEDELLGGRFIENNIDTMPEQVDESKLSAFADFVNSLDLDDLDDDE